MKIVGGSILIFVGSSSMFLGALLIMNENFDVASGLFFYFLFPIISIVGGLFSIRMRGLFIPILASFFAIFCGGVYILIHILGIIASVFILTAFFSTLIEKPSRAR